MRSKLLRIAAPAALVASSLFAAHEPPALRLGNDVVPERMMLDLTLSPLKTDFSGTVEADIEINTGIDHFWLNATDLTITAATLTQKGKTLQAQISPEKQDFVGFQFPSTLIPGKAHIKLTYTGKVNLRASDGLFLSKRNSDAYLFTQFEAISARTAFPCFDEPGFKIPWRLTLHVPQDDVADANTKIESERQEGNGMKAVRFAETKPLPSYLVAFAVGPLNFVDAGTAGSRHIPVRIVVPRGDEERAKYAASISAEIITREEQYFGIPFPYDKSDQVAIPLSFGGAMENPGLITYDANIILSPPEHDTVEHQREYASIAAHELAHQWTGDLVTMAWWNDTWLNESFATWMAARLLAEWKPEWNTRAEDQAARLRAMGGDTETTARRIAQPVENNSDIANAFDGITYEKGGSVLAMFENASGPKNFQRAVHDYLKAHEFGNATAEDFLTWLGKDTKPEFATAFATFLNQTGVPEVATHLQCEGGRAAIDVEQQRLLPRGSTGDVHRTWGVPVCVAYSTGSAEKSVCQIVTEERAKIDLAENTCPAWYLANDKEIGYYVAKYDSNSLSTLLDHRKELSLSEEVGMLGELHMLAQNGKVPFDEVLALVPKVGDDPRREVVEEAIRLATIPPEFLDSGLRQRYASYVDEVFGARARELGWTPKPGEPAEDQLLRPRLVAFVARWGKDPQLIAEAKRLANDWLANHGALPQNVAGSVLAIAARNSGADLYGKVLAAAKGENDPYYKPMLITTLGDFEQPELAQRSLQTALDGTFDFRMSLRIILGEAQDPQMAKVVYRYVREHYEDVVAKLPNVVNTDYAAFLPFLASSAECTDTAATDAKQFFEPRMAKVTGGPRSLENAVEAIHLCAAAKPAASSEIARFLSKYPAKESTDAGGK